MSRLSQLSSKPTRSAQGALIRVLKYLRVTANFSVEQRATGNKVEYYSDSDHAGDYPHTTKSQTGTMIVLNGAPVFWSSKKQTESTAYSSAMAEIYALSETARAVRLFGFRAEGLGMQLTWPAHIQVDNDQVRSFVHGSCMNSRIRGCVDMRLQWIREIRDQAGTGQIKIVHVSSKFNKADILTKCMPAWKFTNLLSYINGNQGDRQYAQFIQQVGF